MLGYLFYVIRIGGDFMSGRFLTSLFILAVILITCVKFNQFTKIVILIVIGIFTLVSPYVPVKSNSAYRKNELTYPEIVTNDGIADERAWYYPHTGLLHLSKSFWIETIENNLDTVTLHHDSIISFIEADIVLGYSSYGIGPNHYIFHHMGLTDPLIARLPRDLDQGAEWRAGHIDRKIPEGYVETLKTGVNQMKDRKLAVYFDKLCILTRGKIFDWNRIKTIYKMNTGQYDFLVDRNFYSSLKNR
jgi:arabinofuranosyltransferase